MSYEMYGVNLQNDKTVLNATKCDLGLHHSYKKNIEIFRISKKLTNLINFILMKIQVGYTIYP